MKKLFSELPSEINKQVQDVLQTRQISAGETVFSQGLASKAIYFVADGRVKITRVTRDGNESILCVRNPGDIFCPVPLLDGGDHLGSAIALTDVQLSWIEQELFTQLCARYPELLAYVQGDCLFEVRRLMERMESFAFRSIRERLAFALLDALNRHNSPQIPENEIHLKHTELAGLVGASRESISRILSQFEDQGILLTARGRIKILDQEKLKLVANRS